MARGLTRRQIGVTEQMIEAYGDLVFQLSHNHQSRRGDPIRRLDFAAIEAQRADAGLTDAEIARRIGLTRDQVLFIRSLIERRRFRRGHYQRLLELGGGRRFRAERFTPHEARFQFSSAALELRAAMTFDPVRVARYVRAGWWNGDTLTAWLDRHADQRPERAALVTRDEAIGYGLLRDRVMAFAGGLARLGIGRGDVVAVQLPNVVEFPVAYLAITALGAVMSTLHMMYGPAELQALLGHGRARAVICLAEFKDAAPADTILALKPKLADLDHIIAVGDDVAGAHRFAELAAGAPLPADRERPVAADPFLLLYTSGTTSAPKGVPLTYQTMLGNARSGAAEHGLGADDLVLSAAPFSHLFGLYSIHLALAAGAGMALLPAFAPGDLAALIAARRPTALFAGPAHIAAAIDAGVLADADFSSLKLTVLSGAACPPALVRAIDAKMPRGRVAQLWGMTETQAGLYTRFDDPADAAETSAGRPSPGTEVRIAATGDAPAEPDHEGELQVRGPLLFSGYFNNPDANAQAFTADGWFRTGDLARADRAGNVAITGRIKDLINRGGIKYNPLEIEALLDRHPKIEQAAIVAVADPTLGERAVCFAVPTATASETPPDLAELCAYLTEAGIAKIKLPERLELIAAMPLTPTRKIIKSALRARLG